jgi:predicted DNA-binding protein
VKALAEKKLIISAKKYVGDSAVVSARLPVELIKELDTICEKTGRNRNEVIQMCLEFSVDNIEIER